MTGNCLTCGVALTPNNVGKRMTIEVSYFNGEDEDETYCRKHAHERRMEIRKIHDDYLSRQLAGERKEDELKASLLVRLKEKYDVQTLTPYQWRINGVLDVYPKSRAYHDIKRNKRGGYRDILSFCSNCFPAKP